MGTPKTDDISIGSGMNEEWAEAHYRLWPHEYKRNEDAITSEQLRKWLDRPPMIVHGDIMRNLNALISMALQLESVQRDAECMAEIIINKHPDTWDYDCNDCTCPACTTARKYRREG